MAVNRWLGVVATILVGCSSSDSEPAGAAHDGGPDGGSTECHVSGGSINVSVSPSPEAVLDVTGAISTSASKSFVLDTCPPNADCMPSLLEVAVASPGLELDLPLGAFVRLRYTAESYNMGQVATLLSVRNVPEWGGAANPVATDERWYLLTSEGQLAHPDAPFAVQSVAVECPPPPEAHGKSYRLAVSDGLGGPKATLAQGDNVTIELAGQSFTLMLVRAFEPYGFDYPNPFAWWAKP